MYDWKYIYCTYVPQTSCSTAWMLSRVFLFIEVSTTSIFYYEHALQNCIVCFLIFSQTFHKFKKIVWQNWEYNLLHYLYRFLNCWVSAVADRICCIFFVVTLLVLSEDCVYYSRSTEGSWNLPLIKDYVLQKS